MKVKNGLGPCILAVTLLSSGCSDEPQASKVSTTGQEAKMSDYQGPKDTPTQNKGSDFVIKRQVSIDQAKKTYPDARSRFLKGLPSGYTFFVTVEFQEANHHENAYVSVRRIEGAEVRGILATKLIHVKSPVYGQELKFPESDIIDWTITSADGKEEGNYVGRFLDEYNASRKPR